MNFILIAVIVLGAIGLIAAVVLFAASKKFAVYEDPRIAQVSELLPGANCGGCGFPGCSGMADALVKGADAGSLDGLLCPVGGAETMGKVADLLGMAIANSEPMVAVVRCNGTCEHRRRLPSMLACVRVPPCMPVALARRPVASVAWAVATARLPVSLMLSRSILKRAFLRSTRRNVLPAALV